MKDPLWTYASVIMLKCDVSKLHNYGLQVQDNSKMDTKCQINDLKCLKSLAPITVAD